MWSTVADSREPTAHSGPPTTRSRLETRFIQSDNALVCLTSKLRPVTLPENPNLAFTVTFIIQ